MYNYLENKKWRNKTVRWGSDFALTLEKALEEKGLNTEIDLVDKDVIVENTTLNQVEFAYTLKVITNDKLNSDTLNTLKEALNKVLTEKGLKEVEEYQKSFFRTKRMYWEKDPSPVFIFDFFVISDNNGNYSRLVLKRNEAVELPMINKDDLDNKEGKLRSFNLWDYTLNAFLNKMNMYEERKDINHPAFVCFIESVNEVYYKNFEQNA